MSTSPSHQKTHPDHLARLLDALGSSLDDAATDGTAVASRSHLSRFHFDRLVSASLGEPPGAFRRRLLLERAAHRLIVGRATVLDVAMEAGYGSHEAFTRAFSRAYGRSPREVRRQGAVPFVDLELPAPSGIHYQPPGGLRLPATAKVSQMQLVQQMVKFHVDTLGAIIDRAAALDEKTLDEPITLSVESVDDDMSLRRLLQDLVTQEEHWLNAVRGQGWPDDTDVSVAGMASRHALAGPAFLEFVGDVIDRQRLADTFVDTTCEDAATHTLGGMIAHVLTFGTVRRTIALGALASAGVTDLGAGDPRDVVCS